MHRVAAAAALPLAGQMIALSFPTTRDVSEVNGAARRMLIRVSDSAGEVMLGGTKLERSSMESPIGRAESRITPLSG
jgi:hypothetical protein